MLLMSPLSPVLSSSEAPREEDLRVRGAAESSEERTRPEAQEHHPVLLVLPARRRAADP